MMRVTVEHCLLAEVSPGELYTFADQTLWDRSNDPTDAASGILGHIVHIRSNAPCEGDNGNVGVYRITVHKDNA